MFSCTSEGKPEDIQNARLTSFRILHTISGDSYRISALYCCSIPWMNEMHGKTFVMECSTGRCWIVVSKYLPSLKEVTNQTVHSLWTASLHAPLNHAPPKHCRASVKGHTSMAEENKRVLSRSQSTSCVCSEWPKFWRVQSTDYYKSSESYNSFRTFSTINI